MKKRIIFLTALLASLNWISASAVEPSEAIQAKAEITGFIKASESETAEGVLFREPIHSDLPKDYYEPRGYVSPTPDVTSTETAAKETSSLCDYEEPEEEARAEESYTEEEPEPEPEPETDSVPEPSMNYLGEWTITFYCNCEICCGAWAGGATASGAMPTPWYAVATDGLPFGTSIYIEGYGYFTVEDRGTGYGWADIFVNSHEEAIANGMKTASVYLVG